MALATLNIQETDKASFLELKLKHQLAIKKEVSQATFFKHMVQAYSKYSKNLCVDCARRQRRLSTW